MKMEILIPSFSLKSCSSNGEMVGSILPLKRQLLKEGRPDPSPLQTAWLKELNVV
uniref:Uncharacterized protein n=2 Tax=Rhizophora mucronata TaxID=61149 RepID=A0A2P2MVY1_RHIMU